MAYKNLQHFIQTLEAAGELKRIRAFVDPVLEITEVVDRVSKNNGPALLFENTGTKFPLLINSMGSYKRMCLALGVEQMDTLTREIEGLFKELTSPKDGIVEKLKMLPQTRQNRFLDAQGYLGKRRMSRSNYEGPRYYAISGNEMLARRWRPLYYATHHPHQRPRNRHSQCGYV
jgi:3-polyprenyl-4-hydroxybenzoate decarboxylase